MVHEPLASRATSMEVVVRDVTPAENARLLSALGYAKRGWSVFPCRMKAKEPATRHGFKDSTRDKAAIIRWWSSSPLANVAVATGGLSGIVVLDVDPRNGGDGNLAELEQRHGALPETVSACSGGGGRHFYFAMPVGVVLKSGKLADGLDFKAEGGYVIAPPSVHPSGQPYRWDRDPRETRLAACPDWLRAIPAEGQPAPDRARTRDAAQTVLGRAFAEASLLGRALEGGKRAVVCPWQEQHTSGAPFDSSTVLFPANAADGLGGFHCSHSHCAGRTSKDAVREVRRKGTSGGASKTSWMTNLRRTEKGEVRASLANLVQILEHDDRYERKLRLDEMRGVVLFEKDEMTDAAVSGIRIDLEVRYGLQATEPETARAVAFVASRNSFHPVREFLEGLTWDGTPRLHRIAHDILRVRADSEEEAELAALLVRRWFIGLVGRPCEPGCKLDTALILQGAQGVGKSTFFRVIGGTWFSDTEMALDKDALMQLRGAWIYEWAELENVMGRHAVARVKAFLTSTEDKYRPPFGRTPITVRRSGVIVGTTNNEDFLHDPTGSRRFWVVPVGVIDLARLRAEREELLAEAVAAWRGKERRWLSEEEERNREALAQRFVETDPWEARVLEFAERQDHVRTADVLLQALDVPMDKLTRRDEMRIASILRRSGYAPRRSRLNGRPERYWSRHDE